MCFCTFLVTEADQLTKGIYRYRMALYYLLQPARNQNTRSRVLAVGVKLAELPKAAYRPNRAQKLVLLAAYVCVR